MDRAEERALKEYLAQVADDELVKRRMSVSKPVMQVIVDVATHAVKKFIEEGAKPAGEVLIDQPSSPAEVIELEPEDLLELDDLTLDDLG